MNLELRIFYYSELNNSKVILLIINLCVHFRQAYKEGKKEKPFIPTDETEVSLKPNIPEDLTCSLCQDLLTDAVMMPCCGNSFCDECK